MTLDSSALIAVLFAEPGYLDLVDRILAGDHVRIGAPTRVEDPSPIIHEMRLRRSAAELARHRRACEISRDGHIEAMRYARPGLCEYQVQAAMEFVFREGGSPRNGYPSIVASGPNACILHYT